MMFLLCMMKFGYVIEWYEEEERGEWFVGRKVCSGAADVEL
jgi:hypothetical protein